MYSTVYNCLVQYSASKINQSFSSIYSSNYKITRNPHYTIIRGGERSRIRPSMVKGLSSTVNVAEEKQRFVPQTSCLQQQGLILALRVNTSVTLDPLFTQKDRHTHTSTPPPPWVLYPPPASSTEVNYQNCV